MENINKNVAFKGFQTFSRFDRLIQQFVKEKCMTMSLHVCALIALDGARG
jgi:hypothetical protein